jgi:hypothetical protein
MALKKEKTNGQGVKYDYWVAQPMIDAKQKKTSVLMLGFISKEARDNGANFIERVRVQGELDGVENTMTDIYAFVKRSILSGVEVESEEEPQETNWFVDAEDC